MNSKKVFAWFATLSILLSLIGVSPVTATGGGTRQIPSAGTYVPADRSLYAFQW